MSIHIFVSQFKTKKNEKENFITELIGSYSV